MNLRATDHASVREWLARAEAGQLADEGGPLARAAGPLSFVAGSGLTISDGYKNRKPPSSTALLDAARGIAYALANINARGVARNPLRLYATTRPGQKPLRSWVARRPVDRRRRDYMESLSFVASRSADQHGTEVEEVTTHPIIETLKKPHRAVDSPFKGARSLIYFLQLSQEVAGSGFWYQVFGGFGQVAELWPISPRHIMPIPRAKPDADGNSVDYYQGSGGERYAIEEIARFRALSLANPYLGHLSPLEAAIQEAGIRDKFDAQTEAILGSMVRPSAVISAKNPDRPLAPEVEQRLVIDVRKAASRARQGEPIVVPGAIDFKEWRQAPADLGGLEISRDAKTSMCNVFDVPMTLLEMTTSNRASAEAGNYAHAYHAIAPRCEMLAEQLTGWIASLDNDPADPLGWDRLFFCFDNPVPEDEERRAKILVGYAGGKPILSQNEARAEIGYGPNDAPECDDLKPVVKEKPGQDGGQPKPKAETDE